MTSINKNPILSEPGSPRGNVHKSQSIKLSQNLSPEMKQGSQMKLLEPVREDRVKK